MCSSLAQYPTYGLRRAAGALIDDSPLICGGSYSSYVSECYYHDVNSNEWKLVGNMHDDRGKGSGTLFDGKLWAVGGNSNAGLNMVIDIIDLEGTTTGPTLPRGKKY